jgi:hypothetical protein
MKTKTQQTNMLQGKLKAANETIRTLKGNLQYLELAERKAEELRVDRDRLDFENGKLKARLGTLEWMLKQMDAKQKAIPIAYDVIQ